MIHCTAETRQLWVGQREILLKGFTEWVCRVNPEKDALTESYEQRMRSQPEPGGARAAFMRHAASSAVCSPRFRIFQEVK